MLKATQEVAVRSFVFRHSYSESCVLFNNQNVNKIDTILSLL